MIANPISSLIKSLAQYTRPYDYELFAAQHQLRQTTHQGFFNIIVAAGSTFPTLAELHFGIRIDLVEQLVYQFTTGLAGYGPHSTTLIASSGRIVGQPYLRYPIDQVADVETVAQQMKDFMWAEGFPFLQRYGGSEALDGLYNDNPTQKSSLLTNELNRSLRGIVLARLTHRSDWRYLVDTYRTLLTQRGTPESLIERYDQLANYLQTFSVN